MTSPSNAAPPTSNPEPLEIFETSKPLLPPHRPIYAARDWSGTMARPRIPTTHPGAGWERRAKRAEFNRTAAGNQFSPAGPASLAERDSWQESFLCIATLAQFIVCAKDYFKSFAASLLSKEVPQPRVSFVCLLEDRAGIESRMGLCGSSMTEAEREEFEKSKMLEQRNREDHLIEQEKIKLLLLGECVEERDGWKRVVGRTAAETWRRAELFSLPSTAADAETCLRGSVHVLL